MMTPTDGLRGRFTISKSFELNGVSHELRLLPVGHKCRRNHGHNYVVTVTVTAEQLDEYGFVTDFGELDGFASYLREQFDHRLLNDAPGAMHPGLESVCRGKSTTAPFPLTPAGTKLA